MDLARKKPSFEFEQDLWMRGYTHVIGLDEVGRGAFAGPLVVGAVIFPKDIVNKDTPWTRSILADINDSKLLTPKKRETLVPLIKESALYTATLSISVRTI